MREIRQSGSEGGVAGNGDPYPYLATPRRSPSGLSLIPLEVRSSEAGRTTVVGEVQRPK